MPRGRRGASIVVWAVIAASFVESPVRANAQTSSTATVHFCSLSVKPVRSLYHLYADGDRNPYVIHALPGLTEFSGDGVFVASPRGRILDAMTATVAERGYAATSIAEVIKRAHASRSTFYEQFADKEDCFLAAYQLASDHIATQIRTAAQSSQPNLADRLSQIYETYLDELARYPLAARAFHVEIRAAGAPSQEHRRAANNQFAELLLVPAAMTIH